jgi:FtsH-binding integral membrane protein
MALFIWLDVSRYRAYMPLFISGKCISIFSLLGWFIVFVKGNIIEVISGVFIASDFVFLCGDLIALAFIVLILTDTQKLIEKQEPARRQEVLKGAGNTEENNENNSNSQR